MQQNGFKLFVGSLPSDITREELQIVFQTYGEVTDIHVMSAAKSVRGDACGFVSYARREAAEDAIQVLDGVYKIREGGSAQAIKVSWALPKGQGDSGNCSKGKGEGKGKCGAGYGDGPWGADPGKGSWGSWQGGGGNCKGAGCGGNWSDPWQDNSWNYKREAGCGSGVGTGWGGGNQQNWGGKGGGNVGHPMGISGKGSTNSGETCKLFVGNLPGDIGDDALHYVFGTYGRVQKTHIMAGRSQSGQSCAFIEYSTPEEAETAILTLHEKYEIRPGDGVILVKHANNGRSRPTPY